MEIYLNVFQKNFFKSDVLVPISKKTLEKIYYNYVLEHETLQDSYIELWKFAKGVG